MGFQLTAVRHPRTPGVFPLDADKEYRLNFRNTCMLDVERELQGVNCDLLGKIEVPLRVAMADLIDQTERRIPRVRMTAEAEAARIKKALNATKVVVKFRSR